MSRTKTGRALIYVVNNRYEVALTTSLSLKASNIFLDWKFWLKNGPKSEFSGNRENHEILKRLTFCYFQCVLSMKIHFMSKFR